MEHDGQIAFWINVHNALVMHAAYNICGHIISANAIEQVIIGFRTPCIGRWLESFVSAGLRKKYGEEQQLISSKLYINDLQPHICFALCTGAFSEPVLKVYTASNIREQLNIAKRGFPQANVAVKKSSTVFLPKLVERFSREALINLDELFGWVMYSVDKKLHDSMQK
ncbi:uncharacterized protein [Phaseolus vulgaris]|uniref:uncharacterized protein n=1 Tax=Phaseolus vulgaris TaxID=3885 RepID=UPI0035CC326B